MQYRFCDGKYDTDFYFIIESMIEFVFYKYILSRCFFQNYIQCFALLMQSEFESYFNYIYFKIFEFDID